MTTLRKQLSAQLRLVRSGEEVIVVIRSVPVARISPLLSISDEKRQLVASGQLKSPEEEVKDWNKFWDNFFAMPAHNLSQEEATKAVLEEREEPF